MITLTCFFIGLSHCFFVVARLLNCDFTDLWIGLLVQRNFCKDELLHIWTELQELTWPEGRGVVYFKRMLTPHCEKSLLRQCSTFSGLLFGWVVTWLFVERRVLLVNCGFWLGIDCVGFSWIFCHAQGCLFAELLRCFATSLPFMFCLVLHNCFFGWKYELSCSIGT